MSKSKKIMSHKKKTSARKEQDEFSAAIAVANAAQVKAAKARADAAEAEAEAERAIDEAIRIGEALRARIGAEASSTNACAVGPRLHVHDCSIRSRTRDLLVKALGMLGSDHAGERAVAALMAMKQRVKLGMTWDELIVRVHDDEDDLDDDDDYEYIHDDDDDLDDEDLDDDEAA